MANNLNGLLGCIKGSDLSDKDKAKLIEELRSSGFDPVNSKILMSNSEVFEGLSKAMKEKIVAEKRKQYQKMLQVNRAFDIEATINKVVQENPGVKGAATKTIEGILGVTADEIGLGKYGIFNQRAMASEMMADWMKGAEELFSRFMPRLGFVTDVAGQQRLFKALAERNFADKEFGEQVKALSDGIERARQRWNQAGGDYMEKMEGYIMPTIHNAGRMLKIGKNKWMEFWVKQRVTDLSGRVLEGEEKIEMLSSIYDSVIEHRPLDAASYVKVGDDIITTAQRDGAIKKMEKRLEAAKNPKKAAAIKEKIEQYKNAQAAGIGVAGEASLAQMRGQSRLLNFNDFDSWLEYQDMMGNKDLWATFHASYERMAEDIALMEAFGPNAKLGFAFAKQKAVHLDGNRNVVDTDTGKKYRMNKFLNTDEWLDAQFAVASGEIYSGGTTKAAQALAGTRNVASALMLSKAVVMALFGDQATAINTALYRGMNVGRLEKWYAKVGANQREMSKLAARTGMAMTAFVNNISAASRFSDIGGDVGWTSKLVNFTTASTGLQYVTRAIETAFHLETMQTIGERLGRSLADLEKAGGDDARFAEMMRHYGVTDAEWDTMGSSGVAKYFDMDGNVYDRDANGRFLMMDIDALDELGEFGRNMRIKIMNAVETESNFAVIQGTTQSRAVTTLGKTSGLAGQSIRTFTQFSTHPVTYQLLHMRRGLQQVSDAEGKLAGYKYLAGLIGLSTIAGGLALMTKDVINGKSPREAYSEDNWNNAKFVAAAMATGGGFGPWFDIATSASQENGLQKRLAGPGFRILDSMLAPVSNIKSELARGNPNMRHYFATVIADTKGLLPTNAHWGTIWASDMITQTLLEYADPAYAARYRNKREKAANELGQEYIFGEYAR